MHFSESSFPDYKEFIENEMNNNNKLSKPIYIETFYFTRVCNKSRMTGATCGAGTAYPSGALVFTPRF